MVSHSNNNFAFILRHLYSMFKSKYPERAEEETVSNKNLSTDTNFPTFFPFIKVYDTEVTARPLYQTEV